ncbi:hypothetical protein J0S82_010165, partial [Galemys pyrenaicus]
EQDITLNENVEILAKLFSFGINSILYQHCLHTSETGYVSVVVISNIGSGEVLDRWQFDIEHEKIARGGGTHTEKSLRE